MPGYRKLNRYSKSRLLPITSLAAGASDGQPLKLLGERAANDADTGKEEQDTETAAVHQCCRKCGCSCVSEETERCLLPNGGFEKSKPSFSVIGGLGNKETKNRFNRQ